MAGSTTQPHLVLVPWIGGVSHIIPMTDIGCLLAAHGATVTIVTTPANAPIVQSRVDRAAAEITVTAISFPAAEAGLLEGLERLDLLHSPADVPRFFAANSLFGEAVARHCRDPAAFPLPPSCIVAGMCHAWALPLARDLGVPCYIFHGFGAFALLCIERLYSHRDHETAASDDEPFDVPALPGFECRITRRQLPPHFLRSTAMGGGLLREVREFDVAVDGVVVNSFEELERGSAALLAAAEGKKVLAVGPVSLSPGLDPKVDMTDDAKRCMTWLDGKEPRSVVYVSFGSFGCMPPAQLLQLGKALVACPYPVLWVIKGADALPDDVKKWLHDNADGEDGKCLVVRGWAPQVAILDHPAVGGFMTHCGWGSTLEAVAAGVPMVTWPLFAEQFLNEQLIVNVLGIGASVGVAKPTENILTASTKTEGGKTEVDAEVRMEQVMRALDRLMDQGVEGEERRRKALELKDRARGALEKGGSSYENLEKLIHSPV